jgi:WD40 repeat protein
MGEVYEARQGRLDRKVAVKVIRSGRISPEARGRFDREQQTLAKLHQTHIVPIHTSGEDNEVQFFAMAYIAGAALNRVVQTAYDRETAGPHGSTPELRELAASATPDVVTEPGTPATWPAPRDPDVRLFLSADYFRSVAAVMVQAAEAVQHAHDAGVCHRDIKPSNLMVDRDGHCWIIDFGLAGHLTRDPAADTEPDVAALTRGAMGTPQYMAPEQYEQKPEYRSDVWALGATLYELLTLRRAFDGPTREAITGKVLTADPRPVRELAPTVPRDLAAISRKALRKAPSDRYPTAADFAADLRRWLNREPVTARPAHVIRRVSLWSARNPGWAVAITCTLVAAAAIGVTAYSRETARAGEADARAGEAEARTAEAKVKEGAAEQRRKDQELAALLLESTNLRLGTHRVGWSGTAWGKVRAAADLRTGPTVRDEAAATLVGMDAEVIKELKARPQDQWKWVNVAFSPDGRRVLAGGFGNHPTWLWDRETGKESLHPESGQGPVGFTRDGTAVQAKFPTGKQPSLVIWDVVGAKPMCTIALGFAPPGPVATWVLTADATRVALGFAATSGKVGDVGVWDASTGALVRRVPAVNVTGLAVSPDGKLLAVGNEDGEVTVWPLPSGEPITTLRCGRTRVQALAFGSLFRRLPIGPSRPRWLLAAGDAGGTINIWDLARGELVSRCLGSHHGVFAVTFSPDGTTLASTGRQARLWDVVTGRDLLRLQRWDYTAGVAFAPDGTHLVIGTTEPRFPSRVDVWKLQDGRGVHTLRGLASQVSLLRLSSDGTLLAGLSHDWQVGVWEVGGRLRHVLDVPRGSFADNAALAFSPDGKRFGFSAGTEAVVWDVEEGRRLERWTGLPPGLADQISFHPDGGVYLFRTEGENGRRPPVGNIPRVCRIRELLPGGRLKEIQTITDFPVYVEMTEPSPDGRLFAALGVDKNNKSAVRMYDAVTGREVWWTSVPTGGDLFTFDPAGPTIFTPSGGKPAALVTELPGGKLVGTRDLVGGEWGPGGKLFAHFGRGKSDPHRYGVSLFQDGNTEPVVTIPLRVDSTSVRMLFSADGRHLVWGNGDGSMMVADIPVVKGKLDELKLGW